MKPSHVYIEEKIDSVLLKHTRKLLFDHVCASDERKKTHIYISLLGLLLV